MKKRIYTAMALMGIVALVVAGLAMAGTTFDDVVQMKNEKAFERHTKGIATFTHKKHTEDYGLSCGECHHDDKGQPLDLSVGDEVQHCLECHEPGRADRAKLRGLSRDERQKEEIKYYYGAIHENCQGCHEAFNQEKTGNARRGPAPTSCAQCHPRQPR